jgi:uncharacterized protein with PIN domain
MITIANSRAEKAARKLAKQLGATISDAVAVPVSAQGHARRTRPTWHCGRCRSYPLAKALNVPLLCVGSDFSQTDLQTL